MTWFKVDDTLAFHHKVVAAGNAAMGVWVRAGAMCSQQLTDGFVPHHMVAMLGGAALAKRLEAVGLWAQVEGGYQFHEWEQANPSREQVESERATARERMQKLRGGKPVRPNKPRTNAEQTENFGRSSPEVLDPEVLDPVPSRSSFRTIEGAQKRATKLPEDWQPNEQHRAYCQQNGIDLDHEADQFRSHHTAKGSTFKSWDAAFRTWLGNTKKWARSQPASESNSSSGPPSGYPEDWYGQ